MRSPIPLTKRVALTIWKMATNADYRTIERVFGVAKSTICKILREVCEAIVQKFMSTYVQLPKSGDKLREMATAFESQWGMPQCVGAIDCTHIPIIAPANNTSGYFNQKGWHSLMTQIVVDSSYCIMNVHIGNTGTLHDAELFASSDLYQQNRDSSPFPDVVTKTIDGVRVPYFIVGDDTFPLLTWLMKPYPTDDNEVKRCKQIYNQKVDAIHQTARHAVCRLKGRWRCLQTRNDSMVDFSMLIIQACCILHNICERNKHPYNPEWLTEDSRTDMPVSSPLTYQFNSEEAEKIRHVLAAFVGGDNRT